MALKRLLKRIIPWEIIHFRWMVKDSWSYLSWWEVLNPSNLLLCWRVNTYTQQNMAGILNVRKLGRLTNEQRIPGAFVECGVWRGGCACVMGFLAEAAGRRLWLFDSFVGMPEASGKDVGLGLRKETVVYVKGWFQHTILPSRQKIGPIAILRIDGDWYESTAACLEGLYDNVVEGGFVIIDDYGWFPGCRAAVEEFLARRNLRVRLIPVDYTRVYFQKS